MNRLAPPAGSPPNTAASVPARRPRLAWLDFFRGAAVLVMIETHVVNTFLAASFREGGGFGLLNYVNGLVAPSFLFIAGYVQGLERRRSPGKPIPYARRAGRLAGLAALGYAMHFPIGPLLVQHWSEALRVGSQVDVLQCLAFGLGLLLAVGWTVDRRASQKDGPAIGVRPPWFPWTLAVGALAAVAVLLAPLVQGWLGAPVPFRAWINGTTGSLFPLFPWIGFVFFGALAGAAPPRIWPDRAVSIAMIAAAAWLFRGAVFSATSPAFFLERAAWVLGLAVVCEWSARWPFPRAVLYAGEHSLKFYVAHLVFITVLTGVGVATAALDWPIVAALIVGVTAVSFGAARFLDRLPQFLRPERSPGEERPISLAGDARSPAA